MTDDRVPSTESIRDLFDRIAPSYDRLNQELSLGLHRIWKLMAVKWCDPQPGDSGLDICCGSGDLALLLARAIGSTGRVTGLDFAVRQLAIARHRQQTEAPHLCLNWVEGDALALPFADASFDCVTMGYGLRNVTDIPRCLQEVRRVLKPNAKAAILDFHRPENPLMEQFQRWYLEFIVTPTAKRLDLEQEYAYIMPSLDRFPTGRQQVQLAERAGLQAVHYLIAGGMMGVLVAAKV